MSDQIRVLVVDDSALVRKIITDILQSDPHITVVGTANNGKSAVYKNQELDPDVITMDIEMPVMDGLSALKEIIETRPRPVIMMSVLTQHGADATFRALELGAVDFIPKPSSMLSLSVDEIGDLLISKIKSIYNLTIPSKKPREKKAATEALGAAPLPAMPVGRKSDILVGIGTSTGGPSALLQVFKGIPENFPSSLLVVQHMPEGFTRAFSERLDSASTLSVKEAEDGDEIQKGCGYVAPGNFHMRLEKRGGKYSIRLDKGEKVSGHRPSIDVLFESMAENAGRAVAVIMTGMGRDGAEGIKKIRARGGKTFAQNEETSVVYGMNRVAVENGAIDEIVPLREISKKIVEQI